MLREKLRLYVITDSRLVDEVEGSRLALEGGATAIQLRMKNAPVGRMVEMAKKIRKLTLDYDALFIVDDRIDVALSSGADGVHLGRGDTSPCIARKMDENLVIGATAATLEEALEAQRCGADYLGVGSVYPTASKEKPRIIGVEGLKNIVENVRIPVVAIGGINFENIHEVLKAGVAGVAVISAVMGAGDIRGAARRMRKIVDEYLS